jgi:hypothetical protein
MVSHFLFAREQHSALPTLVLATFEVDLRDVPAVALAFGYRCTAGKAALADFIHAQTLVVGLPEVPLNDSFCRILAFENFGAFSPLAIVEAFLYPLDVIRVVLLFASARARA